MLMVSPNFLVATERELVSCCRSFSEFATMALVTFVFALSVDNVNSKILKKMILNT